jgi:hypothetical protein
MASSKEWSMTLIRYILFLFLAGPVLARATELTLGRLSYSVPDEQLQAIIVGRQAALDAGLNLQQF